MKIIFWISAALIAYVYLGYPCWLWIRGQFRPKPVRRGPQELSVTAVLVVRNEEEVLLRKLDNLSRLNYPPAQFDIVVVSDGSRDETDTILRKFEQEHRLKAILKAQPEGKAAGLNDAIRAAEGEILLFVDARQYIEPNALAYLTENFVDRDIGAVSGELMLGDPASGEAAAGMGVYWRIEKKVRELESASGSVIGATGAIYCARRNLIESLPAGTILDDVLIPMQIAAKGSRVVFDPRARAWDAADLGQEREFGRKVRTLGGNYQLLQLAPWLLSRKNPLRFEFISHKLLRLAVPFALVALLIACIFLSQPIYRAVLMIQAVGYGLSLAAMAKVKIGPLARFADAARTFVVLNSAAAVAFVNFVRGKQSNWVREATASSGLAK